MKAEFTITLTVLDMYRYSMYYAYAGRQGFSSILIAALCVVVGIVTRDAMPLYYTVMYIAIGVVVIIYVPIMVYMRTKRQYKSSKILSRPLHFLLDEEGVHAFQDEERSDLPWKNVFRVVNRRHTIYIYSSLIHAFIFPKNQLGDQCETVIKTIYHYLQKDKK